MLIGVFAIVGGSSKPAQAEMRTSTGEVVGWISVGGGDTAKISMDLPGWAEQTAIWGHGSDDYSLRLTDSTGASNVWPVSLDSQAKWKATLDIDPDTITSAALVDQSGHVWCQAALA
jgi:hypothetical protein